MRFLKANAMQVSALVGATFGVVIPFAHLSAAQTGALVAWPPALGTFLAGMALKRNGNSATPPAAP